MILTTRHITEVLVGYFKERPVKTVWLFGSYARGDADEHSDIDVLVDIDHTTPVGWDYYSWNEELSNKLRKKVDIVSMGWENKYIKPFIDKDKLIIYER